MNFMQQKFEARSLLGRQKTGAQYSEQGVM
jgi:hypothetical protein